MPRTGSPRLLVAVLGLFVCLFGFGVKNASATHFRYVTISWVKDLTHPVAGEYKVTVTVQAGGRWSFPYAAATGQPVSPNACPGVAGTGVPQTNPPFVPTNTMGSGSCPPVGRVIQWAGAITAANLANTLINVKFNGVTASSITNNARVNTVIVSQDLMYTTFTFDLIFTTAQNPIKVFWTSNARISQLLEGNADRPWRAETIIDAAPPNTKSPQVVSLPLIFLTQNQVNTIDLPSVAFDNMVTKWRFSTAAESSLVDTIPGSGAGQMTLDPVIPGRLTFTPTAVGPYAAQFMVGAVDPAAPPGTPPVNSVPIDLIFLSNPPTSTTTLTLDTSPVANDLTKVAQVGQPFSFQVQSNVVPTNSSFAVSINNTPLPPSPVVGQPGAASFVSPPCNGGGPCTGTFSWTPNVQSTSNVVCFQSVATSGSATVTSNSLCININLGALQTTMTATAASGIGGGPICMSATLKRTIDSVPLPQREIAFTWEQDPANPPWAGVTTALTDLAGKATVCPVSTRLVPSGTFLATFTAITNELLASSAASGSVVIAGATASPSAPNVPAAGSPLASVGFPLMASAVLNRFLTPPDGGIFGPPGQQLTFTLNAPDGSQLAVRNGTVVGFQGLAPVTFEPDFFTATGVNYGLKAFFAGSELLAQEGTGLSPTTNFTVYQRTKISIDPVTPTPVQGQPTTVTARLVNIPQNTPVNGKSVTFSFVGNAAAPQTVPTDANGEAQVSVTFQNATPASIKATFSPTGTDVNHLGFAAPEEATIITDVLTATQITILPVTATVGVQKNVTATLRTLGGTGISGATLRFTAVESGEVMGISGPTAGNGLASINWTPAAAFNGTYRVDFEGLPTFAPSSKTNTLVVNKAATTLANLTVANSAVVGSPLPVSTTLTRTDGVPVPAGLDVVFTLSGPSPATLTGTTVAGGAVSVSFPIAVRGEYTVQASFAETDVLKAAISNVAPVSVNQQTALALTSGNAVAGATVRLTATLTTLPGGTPAPAGLNVAFTAGPYSATATTDANGVAFVDLMFPAAEVVSATASFAAADNLLASSAGMTIQVATAATSLTPITVNSVEFVGNTLQVTTTLMRTSAPTGAMNGRPVTFTLAGPGGTVASPPVNTLADGSATISFSLTVRGAYTVTATFAGDSGHDAATRQADVTVYQKTSLVVNEANGVAGALTAISAGLLALPANAPISGQDVSFTFTGNPTPATPTGQTDANGIATVHVNFPAGGDFIASASFANLADFFADSNGNPIPTTATADVHVSKATTSLTALALAGTQYVGDTLAVVTALTRVTTPSGMIANAPVTFTLTGPAGPISQTANTDANGLVQVVFNLTTRGAFTVTASFAGNDALNTSEVSESIVVYQKTQLTLNEPITGISGKPFDVTATLTNVPAGTSLAGQTVTFEFVGGPGMIQVPTDANGIAKVTVSYPVKGFYSVTASFQNVADFFANRSGNLTVESDTADFEVKNTPPTFAPPANMTAEAESASGATVTFTLFGDDAEQGLQSIPAVCTPPSGNFPIGTTTVNCTVTDDADATATGSFLVTVEDTTKPVLNLPAPVVHATGPSGAAVIYTATATDIVDGTTAVECGPVSGSTFPIGTTTVSCSSTDAHNNTITGTFDVSVTNATPVAVANAYTTNANTLLTVAAPGVLAGDSDADGDAITAQLVAGGGPAHGTLTLNADGSFTYNPTAGYAGPDSFTYLAYDGRQSGNTVTVSLTVQSPEQVAAQTSAVVTAVDPGLANDVQKILDKKQGCMEAAKLTDKITKDKKYTPAEKAAMLAAVAALAQSMGCP